MKNQMIRVLVMSLVADVISSVVQQRGVRKRVAILFRAAQAFTEGVEQHERKTLHVRRVRLFDVASQREVADGSRARFAWIRDSRRDPRGLEK